LNYILRQTPDGAFELYFRSCPNNIGQKRIPSNELKIFNQPYYFCLKLYAVSAYGTDFVLGLKECFCSSKPEELKIGFDSRLVITAQYFQEPNQKNISELPHRHSPETRFRGLVTTLECRLLRWFQFIRTWSRLLSALPTLKLAGFSFGGSAANELSKIPTMPCAGTSKNARLNHWS
jgi:hypothetical protein